MSNSEDQAAAEQIQDPANPSNAKVPEMGDPRYSFAVVAQAVGSLMESTPVEAASNSTPCDGFTVKQLMEHMIVVMRRVALIGEGGVWSTINEVPQENGWVDSFRSAAHDVMKAWTDEAKLEQMFEVPWGQAPGGPMILTYTGELAVHGWDLAKATNQEFRIDDEVLQGALMAAKFIPAEGREDPSMPFSPPVDAGPQATVLEQIVGWLGRSPN